MGEQFKSRHGHTWTVEQVLKHLYLVRDENGVRYHVDLAELKRGKRITSNSFFMRKK